MKVSRGDAEKENGLWNPSTVDLTSGQRLEGDRPEPGDREGKRRPSPSWPQCKIMRKKLQCLLQNFRLYLCEAR